MDREIKFRAWLKEDKEMMPWVCMNQNAFNYPKGKALFKEMFNAPNVVLMQYTGLKDKNGQEIYEGDIVDVYLYEYAGIGEIQTLIVGDNKDNTNFYKDVGYLQNIDNNHIEVVGNIYESN